MLLLATTPPRNHDGKLGLMLGRNHSFRRVHIDETRQNEPFTERARRTGSNVGAFHWPAWSKFLRNSNIVSLPLRNLIPGTQPLIRRAAVATTATTPAQQLSSSTASAQC